MKDANEQQRLAFSLRLSEELSQLGLPVSSPTQVARAYSHRFPDQAVTAQTVRKWLLGEAIPVQAKLLALAEWFGVSAQWLRYGTGSRDSAALTPVGVSNDLPVQSVRAAAVAMVLELSARDFAIVEGLMRLMLKQCPDE